MSDVTEIVKSGAMDKIADIVHKLAGPMAEEYGLLLADRAKVYRVKNWVRVVQKTERILHDAGLSPKAVPPRLFLPIAETSSVENDDTLQSLWAGLLATASEESDDISPSFIDTLRQLTPKEAQFLSFIYEQAVESSLQRIAIIEPDPAVSDDSVRRAYETFERLGIVRTKYELEKRTDPAMEYVLNRYDNIPGTISYFRPKIGMVHVDGDYVGTQEPDHVLKHSLCFTSYGFAFMKACTGPGAAVTSSDTNSDPNL